jgi:3'-5' exoribonuclease
VKEDAMKVGAKIRDMKDGEIVKGTVMMIMEADRRLTRARAPFVSMRLSDDTGTINAVRWGATPEDEERLIKGRVIVAQGAVKDYLNQPQLTLEAYAVVEDPNYAELLPRARYNIENVIGSVEDLLATIKDEHLMHLVDDIWDLEDFRKDFSTAPAAIGMHHAYIGGLAVHTLEVMMATNDMASRVGPLVNRDLALAGAFLHDIGKAWEYDWKTGLSLTTLGKLLGHIFLGAKYVDALLHEQGPHKDNQKLVHIILAHHGKLEWGSPVTPKTPEAVIVHQADMISSRVGALEDAKETADEEGWSNWSRLLDGRMFFE